MIAAHFWSKWAEEILAPYVQALVGVEEPPEISSPLLAVPWDYSFNGLHVDLKLACKARFYGKISDKTLARIRKSLENHVLVALFIPPRLYLLYPWDDTWDGSLDSLDSLKCPSVLVPESVVQEVCEIYDRIVR